MSVLQGRKRLMFTLTVIVLAVAFAWVAAWQPWPHGRADDIDLTDLDPSALEALPDQAYSISAIEYRTQRDPRSFIDFTLLGDLHLRALSRTGDASAARRAEAAFAMALEINPAYAPALAGYGSALFSQHRFEDAIAWSAQVPEGRSRSRALATIADSQLAVGRYEEAEASYAQLAKHFPGPATDARTAQLLFLKGDIDGAVRLARSAAGAAYASGTDSETVAWHLSRVAEQFFSQGALSEASDHFRSALRLNESHYPSLAGMAKVKAAQGKLRAAADLYVQAAGISPQPHILATLGDVYTKMGRTQDAALQYETVELIGRLAQLNGSVYDRDLSVFYSRHGIKAAEAVRLAEAENRVRRDVHGFDALAWAYFRSGRLLEAEAAMAMALQLGTQDATLHYHAGMIYSALDRKADAMRTLEEALRINPYFSLLDADQARASLAELVAETDAVVAGVLPQ